MPSNAETEVLVTDQTDIEHLLVPNAFKVYVRRCPKLRVITTHKAKHISVYNCDTLVALNAPNAKQVYIHNCSDLVTVSAPEAQLFTVTSANALTELRLPKAKQVHTWNCQELSAIDAPRVSHLSIIGSHGFGAIKLPEVQQAIVKNCRALHSIDCSGAGRFTIEDCPVLEHLRLPNASHVELSNLPILRTLKTKLPLKSLPRYTNLYKAVKQAIRNGALLDVNCFHDDKTGKHCLAGWINEITGARALETLYPATLIAGAITFINEPDHGVPNFLSDHGAVLDFLDRVS